MTIKQFIEKAVEGGWVPPKPTKLKVLYEHDNGDGIRLPIIWLDPLAWQAVGKVEGWKLHDSRWDDGLCTDCYKEESHDPDWKQNFIGMARALAEGKTIEQYLETL